VNISPFIFQGGYVPGRFNTRDFNLGLEKIAFSLHIVELNNPFPRNEK